MVAWQLDEVVGVGRSRSMTARAGPREKAAKGFVCSGHGDFVSGPERATVVPAGSATIFVASIAREAKNLLMSVMLNRVFFGNREFGKGYSRGGSSKRLEGERVVANESRQSGSVALYLYCPGNHG